MTKAVAIVGSLFGDEGKGLMTDYHTHAAVDPIVVRFNGGAQAGHTVTLSDGTRHVFSHVGSGSLVGAPTFLSKHFVCNPFLFEKEYNELGEKGIVPIVVVDPDCMVTTPYDMLINQIIERRRGDNHHGSCGVGFGETIERNHTVSITVRDLVGCVDSLIKKIQDIRAEYFYNRVTDEEAVKHKSLIESQDLLNHFIGVCSFFTSKVQLSDPTVLKQHQTLIFEGAQGLLLDQDSEHFPHVTRSYTGTKNVSDILNSIDYGGELTVNYIARAYNTRHGAGQLNNERDELPHNIVDSTNIPNEFQGSLRFALSDISEIGKITAADFQHVSQFDPEYQFTTTCVDQLASECEYVEGGLIHTVSRMEYVNLIKSHSDYISYGPTRNTTQHNTCDGWAPFNTICGGFAVGELNTTCAIRGVGRSMISVADNE